MKILILHVQSILSNASIPNLCVDMLDDSLSVIRFAESSYIRDARVGTVIGFPRLFTLWWWNSSASVLRERDKREREVMSFW